MGDGVKVRLEGLVTKFRKGKASLYGRVGVEARESVGLEATAGLRATGDDSEEGR